MKKAWFIGESVLYHSDAWLRKQMLAISCHEGPAPWGFPSSTTFSCSINIFDTLLHGTIAEHGIFRILISCSCHLFHCHLVQDHENGLVGSFECRREYLSRIGCKCENVSRLTLD
jgi:hypothetical protein